MKSSASIYEKVQPNSSLEPPLGYWFDHLERMKESAWSDKCGTFNISSSFPR